MIPEELREDYEAFLRDPPKDVASWFDATDRPDVFELHVRGVGR